MKSSWALASCARATRARALRGPRAAAATWAGAILLAALSACRTTTPPPLPAPTARSVPVETTPAWVGEPLSWEQLREIETWLAVHGHEPGNAWAVEAELELNRGRLEFARRDASAGKVPAEAVQARVRTARAGFERVVARADATPAQKKRAQDGIARAQRMSSDAPAKPKSSSIAMIARTKWGALIARTDKMDKTKGGYRKITVHHSAEREPLELKGSIAESAAAVRSIQRAHMNGKNTGYGDIGYHFLIDPFGNVFEGRSLAWQGAHSTGANNVQNIGVCLLGNFENEKPTQAALDALTKMLDELRAQYSIPRSNVVGHCDLKNTVCPGKYLEPWVAAYGK
jgi:hypothetical protein